MSRFISVALLAAAPLLLTPGSSEADERDSFDRTPVDCINVNRIRRTEILDDQTVLFHMRGTAVYRNFLPQTCPGLEREERFGYRTTGGRLCRIDTITVIERFGAGMTCRLGQFHPVSAEEIEELRQLGRSPVEARPAEVPDEDANGQDDEAQADSEE